jgi:DNA phosphorothioation-associated putative methyltransferase
MKMAEYETLVAAIPFGKRLADAVYVHREGLGGLGEELTQLVEGLIKEHGIGEEFNVLKLRTQQAKLSLLAYEQFFDNPHPALKKSVTIDLQSGKERVIDYQQNPNPPILHRKETLLPTDHPQIPLFAALTAAEEAAGLFAEPSTIGFRLNWERLLAAKGLEYAGHKLIQSRTSAVSVQAVKVDRHKTAMVRYELSKPVKTLLQYGVLQRGDTFCDYGCGLGADIQGLQSLGYEATGWDPQHKPDGEKRESDVVNLGYVVNVIEDPAERIEVLCQAFRLTRKLLVVSALIEGSVLLSRPKAFGDGLLTNWNTFQKHYEQHELQQFIEDALETTAIPVALGIFYVFRQPTEQQRFLAARTRVSIDRDLLQARTGLLPRGDRQPRPMVAAHKELLDDFWSCLLALGRLPAPEEYPRYSELVQALKSPKRALRLLLQDGRTEAFEKAKADRKADLLVYLASSNLRKRVPLKHLPVGVRFDVKAFFGDYGRGLTAGLELLYSVGDTDEIALACEETSVGWQDSQALYVHKTAIAYLPAVLRAYISCGEVLYGNAAEADLIKLHKSSGKLTFLVYDDFDGRRLPELQYRVKVNLRTSWVQVFDHSAERQLLFYKHRYVHSSHPDYAALQEIGNRLTELAIPDGSFIGPSRSEFMTRLGHQVESGAYWFAPPDGVIPG